MKRKKPSTSFRKVHDSSRFELAIYQPELKIVLLNVNTTYILRKVFRDGKNKQESGRNRFLKNDMTVHLLNNLPHSEWLSDHYLLTGLYLPTFLPCPCITVNPLTSFCV